MSWFFFSVFLVIGEPDGIVLRKICDELVF